MAATPFNARHGISVGPLGAIVPLFNAAGEYQIPQIKNTIFAGPSTGGDGLPNFRTLSLNGNDLADVIITAPTDNQVLTFNNGHWGNVDSVNSSFSIIISTWTLVSNGKYSASIPHNLGTKALTVTLWDAVTDKVVIPEDIEAIDDNTLSITVYGNLRSLRCVVNAGTNVCTSASAVSTVNGRDGAVTITGADIVFALGFKPSAIVKSLSYYAASLDNPNSNDWVVNALAPAVADPTNNAILVRRFPNGTEAGVGCFFTVPLGSSVITFKFKARAESSQIGSRIVQPKIYIRTIPNNAAIGSWSAGYTLNAVNINANTYFQYSEQSFDLPLLNLTKNVLYQLELTRDVVTAGNDLIGNWLLNEFTVEFS